MNSIRIERHPLKKDSSKRHCIKTLIVCFFTSMALSFGPAHADTATADVLVDRIDYIGDGSLQVRFITSASAAINSDGGCGTFWTSIPGGTSPNQALVSMLPTAQSRKSETYVTTRLISGTSSCELIRFVTME